MKTKSNGETPEKSDKGAEKIKVTVIPGKVHVIRLHDASVRVHTTRLKFDDVNAGGMKHLAEDSE